MIQMFNKSDSSIQSISFIHPRALWKNNSDVTFPPRVVAALLHDPRPVCRCIAITLLYIICICHRRSMAYACVVIVLFTNNNSNACSARITDIIKITLKLDSCQRNWISRSLLPFLPLMFAFNTYGQWASTDRTALAAPLGNTERWLFRERQGRCDVSMFSSINPFRSVHFCSCPFSPSG